MLSEAEIMERAKYCYLVFFQLSHLRDRDPAKPFQYLQILKDSSLALHEDEFIRLTMEEEIRMGNPDGGLTYLISLYEGFTHAYCEVIEKDLSEIRDAIPKEFLQKLAAEMGGRL
ncbi:MAG TPA: hypothetical protein PK175_02890 [Syntrophales bacterium]|jgi:hypothetical protein|nr:hypothetical protein [Syntrophales bacterium]HOU77180.1 hypothetical protein [Syntrophales bacterium]HPC32055.1 hypothetical protein [Syntrophales bacterium]HQG33802.1 hypothetical protein [Syntrophales bacterium]HQI35190.1 hypothetical protein [Syntrophales bacterium]